jgi:transcriptional regulator with XRE-family HTH domain
MAHDTDVDRSYVGGLERRKGNPTVDVLDRLVATLSVLISEFFTGHEETHLRLSRCAFLISDKPTRRIQRLALQDGAQTYPIAACPDELCRHQQSFSAAMACL